MMKQNNISKALIMSLSALLSLIAAFFCVAVYNEIQMSNQYDLAWKYLNDAEYELAYQTFVSLESYEDSPDCATYAHAFMYFYDEDNNSLALKEFRSLGDFEYAEQYSELAQAFVYMDEESYALAHDAFLSLEDFENASEYAKYAEQCMTYESAKDMLANGEYEKAISAVEQLEAADFEDSEHVADEANVRIAIESGNYDLALSLLQTYGSSLPNQQSLLSEVTKAQIGVSMESGDYALALEQLNTAYGKTLSNHAQLVEECTNNITYAKAEEDLNNGLNYSAYVAFANLGPFKDAESRAEQCILRKPSTGEMYHASGYRSSACTVSIQNPDDGSCTYFKIYSVSDGVETLVSSIFINAGKKASVNLPAGSYIFKSAYSFGEWFGEKEMFGANGSYERLQYSSFSDVFELQRNYIYTVTLRGGMGNVGTTNENRDDF